MHISDHDNYETLTAVTGLAPMSNLRVRVELASRCNLRCRMCDFSLPDGAKKSFRMRGLNRNMSENVFDRICAELLPYSEECIIGIRAEPTMSDTFLECLRRIAGTNVPKIQIHTNGTLINERIGEAICEHGVKAVIISVDGMKKETYEYIRRGANFDSLMTNVERLVRIRGPNRYPLIQWNFVMMRRNLRELPGLIDLAGDKGVDMVHAFHLTVHRDLNMEMESCLHCLEETNEVLALARLKADERGIALSLPMQFRDDLSLGGTASDTSPAACLVETGCLSGDTADDTVQMGVSEATAVIEAPSANVVDSLDQLVTHLSDTITSIDGEISEDNGSGPICGLPWQEIVVDHNGDVFPCVFWYGDPPLGNVSRQSFAEVWNGESYRGLRSTSSAGNSFFSCIHCPVAAAKLGQPMGKCTFLP